MGFDELITVLSKSIKEGTLEWYFYSELGRCNMIKMGFSAESADRLVMGFKRFLSSEENVKGVIRFGCRDTKENREWIKKVLERDGRVCRICKTTTAKRYDVDHIKPWALYPDLRVDIENGRVLCWECHRKTDTYGAKTRIQRDLLKVA